MTVSGSWTYVDPNDSAKDAVRFLVGDTNGANQRVSDEEILYCLSVKSDVLSSAAMVCRAMASLRVDDASSKSIGDFSISSGSAGGKAWLELADSLDQQAAETNTPVPVWSGTSRARNEVYYADTDFIRPAFTTRMFDIEGSDPDAANYEPGTVGSFYGSST